ncbi:hypothetical protein FA15DRAFT_665398 [Coprinopsis marcescibilis]|uniref:Transmembrane protein n=1 Tax=Coprinopsis marcescibilis TaxID=230819 RepID=A0A5C3L5Y3_COPMA|nr:hypothetical protein FA15DRAFT_665398 [Coprinopsis marcescibilis]
MASESTTRLVPIPTQQRENRYPTLDTPYDDPYYPPGEARPRPPKAEVFYPDGFQRPRPMPDRASSYAQSESGRMSLYEFHQPTKYTVNADAVSKWDYLVLALAILVIGAGAAYLALGGLTILSRPDVTETIFNRVSVAAALMSFICMGNVGAIVLERKVHEAKQRRKHVKKSKSSWTTRPILLLASVVAASTMVLWAVGAIGMIVVHANSEPHKHRHLRNLDGWVGGDTTAKTWKAGEKLGANIFVHGGVLQIPTIISLSALVLSIFITIFQYVQYSVSDPYPLNNRS